MSGIKYKLMWSTVTLYFDGHPVYKREMWLHEMQGSKGKAQRRKQAKEAAEEIKTRFNARIAKTRKWQIQLTIQSKMNSHVHELCTK